MLYCKHTDWFPYQWKGHLYNLGNIKHTLYLRYQFLSWLTCYFVLIPPVIQPAKNTSQLILNSKHFMSINILIHDSTIKIREFGSGPNKQCIISHLRSYFNQMIPIITIYYRIFYLGEEFKNLDLNLKWHFWYKVIVILTNYTASILPANLLTTPS